MFQTFQSSREKQLNNYKYAGKPYQTQLKHEIRQPQRPFDVTSEAATTRAPATSRQQDSTAQQRVGLTRPHRHSAPVPILSLAILTVLTVVVAALCFCCARDRRCLPTIETREQSLLLQYE